MVGAFNSRFIHIKQHYIFRNTLSHSKAKQTIAKEIFTVLTSFLLFLLISISWSFINLLQIKARFISLSVFRISYICVLLAFIHHTWVYMIIFTRRVDIEKNTGPKPNFYQSFSICPWNLNSISAHNFLLFLLEAYNTVHKFDVICLPETYLGSSILHNDNNLQIPGYNLHRKDHLLNLKRGCV